MWSCLPPPLPPALARMSETEGAATATQRFDAVHLRFVAKRTDGRTKLHGRCRAAAGGGGGGTGTGVAATAVARGMWPWTWSARGGGRGTRTRAYGSEGGDTASPPATLSGSGGDLFPTSCGAGAPIT
ncbi:hypothetical protein VaNZ11_016174 [Volvox africanus]|uniref:Uncharacterized protein n=1 Tax=Volvox africanus TaxID=51714 RepID=A0ABQ5SM79_9CHLO|nr:hypothetical protein VaNZ11_016174 [Volvox africanus]